MKSSQKLQDIAGAGAPRQRNSSAPVAGAAAPSSAKGKPKAAKPRLDRAALLAPLQGNIARVPVNFGYRLGLLLVAMMMLILPLVYLSLIGLIGYSTYLYARFNSFLLDAHSRFLMLVFLAPLAVGLLVLVFMIKPFLVRSEDDTVPFTLRREDEPLLFEFIESLCRLVGAPLPSRIDVNLAVNAAAGFRRGWRDLLRRDLVLTIGLPLAATMNAREFAGVLAHELGHFAQGSAMRLTYIIRSIDHWFFRIVYQRDMWDLRLLFACRRGENAIVRIIAYTARLLIGLTRGILWCLAFAGHAVSSMLLRQMEFDADTYECRVGGSETFEQTARKLVTVSVASAVAFSDVKRTLREQQLCDDLPALIRSRENDMPDDVRQKVLEEQAKHKTRWFDSHPCDRDRVAAAKNLNERGLFTIEAPATVLFSNFPGLCRVATIVFYKKQIGDAFKPEMLIKTGAIVEHNAQRKETHSALQRYFRGLIDVTRPVFPSPPTDDRTDHGAIAEQILLLRSKLTELEERARHAAAQFEKAYERRTMLGLVRELRAAGFRKSGAKDPSLDAMSDEVLHDQDRMCKANCVAAQGPIDAALRIAMERLDLALSLGRSTNPRPPILEEVANDNDLGEYELAEAAPRGTGDSQLDALIALSGVQEEMKLLRHHSATLKVLLGRVQAMENPKSLIDALRWHSRKASTLLADVARNLGGVAYPYGGAKIKSLSRYMFESLPNRDQIGEVAATASSALDAYHNLYLRLMSDIAQRAEQLETELGLPPLDEPQKLEPNP